MAITVVLLVVSMAVILLAAELFTNSVEWLGKKLNLGEGAVGSVLAAVGTAMPETMIPIIAILFVGGEAAHEIGIGAILGAPFMLSTAAFSVTGIAKTELNVNESILTRDMGYFMVVYLLAVGAAFIPSHPVKLGIAAFLLALYALYVFKTLRDESPLGEGDLHPLHFSRGHNPPPLWAVIAQFAFALGIMVVAAKVFVGQIEVVALVLGVPALVLSLVIAPVATELPEKFNSIIWVRSGKDTLAMGNITGAMVFQSCIPVAIGLAFTSWELSAPALVSAVIAIGSTGLVLGVMRFSGMLSAKLLASAGVLYLVYVGYVITLL
ncbi:MAG: Sodium/calcium exchanger rane region [Dehalococcoidia bacterium]|nr:Sodium/calcium exchanger rane region [Dehalococcoidia bacterium]